MYEKVFQLKKASYAVMEQEQAENAATLARFRAAIPSKSEITGYLENMKSMMIQQHEYTAKVAMHFLLFLIAIGALLQILMSYVDMCRPRSCRTPVAHEDVCDLMQFECGQWFPA